MKHTHCLYNKQYTSHIYRTVSLQQTPGRFSASKLKKTHTPINSVTNNHTINLVLRQGIRGNSVIILLPLQI